MKLLLILMLMITSCVNSPKPLTLAEVELKLTEEWMYAESIKDLKSNNEEIVRPPGVEQLVLSLIMPMEGGLSRKRHCVYYRIPFKKSLGKLIVNETNMEGDCSEVSSDKDAVISLEGIKKFKIGFNAFKLSLDFEVDKIKKTIVISLPNIEQGLVHERYQPMKEKRLISGLRFIKLNDESFDPATNKYLGKITDRFSKGNAIRCHQVNKDCETIGENRCDECKYGWYEVVDFQCPQGGSKFCGQNHCGEKNEPACPRGIKVVDPEEAGICQSDLEPTLNLEKILVCQ